MTFYKTKPPPLTKPPVGVKQKAYVKKAHGVTRIVRSSYGSKSDWFALCKEIRIRDCYRCIFCKAPENAKAGIFHEVHHLKRLADGGTTTKANLGLTCKTCHTKRPGHSHLAAHSPVAKKRKT